MKGRRGRKEGRVKKGSEWDERERREMGVRGRGERERIKRGRRERERSQG